MSLGLSASRLAFYYPMLALINLFICTLQRPLAPSVQSDIALLEMGTGYFAQLEIATSSALVFPFTRNVAAMARRAIACAKERGIAGGRGANNGSGADASNLCRKTSAVGILNNVSRALGRYWNYDSELMITQCYALDGGPCGY
jgi:hypothetical protein